MISVRQKPSSPYNRGGRPYRFAAVQGGHSSSETGGRAENGGCTHAPVTTTEVLTSPLSPTRKREQVRLQALVPLLLPVSAAAATAAATACCCCCCFCCYTTNRGGICGLPRNRPATLRNFSEGKASCVGFVVRGRKGACGCFRRDRAQVQRQWTSVGNKAGRAFRQASRTSTTAYHVLVYTIIHSCCLRTASWPRTL